MLMVTDGSHTLIILVCAVCIGTCLGKVHVHSWIVACVTCLSSLTSPARQPCVTKRSWVTVSARMLANLTPYLFARFSFDNKGTEQKEYNVILLKCAEGSMQGERIGGRMRLLEFVYFLTCRLSAILWRCRQSICSEITCMLILCRFPGWEPGTCCGKNRWDSKSPYDRQLTLLMLAVWLFNPFF